MAERRRLSVEISRRAGGARGSNTRRDDSRRGGPMGTGLMETAVRRLRRAALRHGGAGLTDGQLLRCFVARRDGDAFAALVRRHGPMVLGLCRRIVGNPHDAEDAFQATFLVLVRKAASLG